MSEEKTREISPSEYFQALKEKKSRVTDADLDRYYSNVMELLSKYQKTGQTLAMRRLMFHVDCIEKERELVKAGINTFVYQDDVTYYIRNVAQKVVKIIELENYPREIPDEIVAIIEKVGPLFDQLYVVFTDYTGEAERQVEKTRRDKDPILFGTFQKRGDRPGDNILNERFYFLGDWIDPWCDLTLDKFVYEMDRAGKKGSAHAFSTPVDLDAIREQLQKLDERDDGFRTVEKPVKKPFWSKVKTFLGGR